MDPILICIDVLRYSNTYKLQTLAHCVSSKWFVQSFHFKKPWETWGSILQRLYLEEGCTSIWFGRTCWPSHLTSSMIPSRKDFPQCLMGSIWKFEPRGFLTYTRLSKYIEQASRVTQTFCFHAGWMSHFLSNSPPEATVASPKDPPCCRLWQGSACWGPQKECQQVSWFS